MTEAAAIPDRRAELHARHAELRQERASTILAGGTFDHSRIAAIETDLGVLDDIEAEQSRRAYEAATDAGAARAAAARQAIAELDRQRHLAVDRAEAAARSMVAAMGDVLQFSASISARGRELGRTPPLQLARNETERRLSRFLTAVLAPVRGTVATFGEIKLRAPHHEPAAAWSDAERSATAPSIADLVKEKP